MKNNCTDDSSYKLAKFHMRKPEHGYGKETFKRETQSLFGAAQNIAIRIYYIKGGTDNTQHNTKSRLCGDGDKSI